MTHIALAQQFVLQHGAECRRDRHRELERHAIIDQSLHHPKQRNVSLGDGLKEPVFFEEMLMLGMPNEGKMRVQNEREIAGPHFRSQIQREKRVSAEIAKSLNC